MGREVRRVPTGWAHPPDKCLYDGADWWAKVRSRAEDLAWYETTTEGSPLSPTFATAEQLADWLVNVHGWPSTVEQTAQQVRDRPKRF